MTGYYTNGGATWVCNGGPLGRKTVIHKSLFFENEIRTHKASCDYCQETERTKRETQELEVDGRLKLRYIIAELWRAKHYVDDFETKSKEIEEQRKKGLKPDVFDLGELRSNAREAKWIVRKERIFLHKLLNDSNEITRKAANEEFQKLQIEELKDFVEKILDKKLLFTPEELQKEEKEADVRYIHSHLPPSEW